MPGTAWLRGIRLKKRSVIAIALNYINYDTWKVWCVWVVDVLDVESWRWALTDQWAGLVADWPQNCCKHKTKCKQTECDWRLLEKDCESDWRLLEKLNLTEGFLENRITETQYHFWLTVWVREPGESRAHRRWQHLASEEVASSRHSEIKSYSENHTQKSYS